jgi:hypothetical protein
VGAETAVSDSIRRTSDNHALLDSAFGQPHTGHLPPLKRPRDPIQLGKTLTGTGFLLFMGSVTWFVMDTFWWPPGTFSPFVPGFGNIWLRTEFVVFPAMTAAGILIWQSASRRLSLADYIIVLSCASVPVLCMFTVYEWARVSFFHF